MRFKVILGTLGAALAMSASAEQAQTVSVTAGTSVAVELMQNVHSSFDTQGEPVYMQALEDVSVDGVIAIPNGARVEGRIGDTKGTGMMGKAGGVSFQPVRIAARGDQWLPLDPTNFGDEGEGAGAGMIVAIGIFAKGKPGFVARGTRYTVTVRRDSNISATADLQKPAVPAADVRMSGTVKPIKTVKTKKTKPGHDIEVELMLPAGAASAAPNGAARVQIVSFNAYLPPVPVHAKAVEFDSRSGMLNATFTWWSVIRYTNPGNNALIALVELSDGRLARADLTMPTAWDID